MALYTRPKFFGLRTNIDTTQIVRSSRMVSSYTGIPVQPNKAIVGANAFAHEAGIHQDGMLKNPLTYEIMKPEVVGLSESNLVLGKHSGRHAFNARLKSLGYELTREQLDQVFDRFKQVCDKKKVVDDRDLEALIADELYQPTETFRLEYVQVTSGTGSTPTATVRLRNREGKEFTDAATGAGPVDAVYRAINRIVGEPNELIEFSIKAIAEGIDSIGEVTIRIQTDQPIPGSPASVFSGHGASEDIIVASGRAYMSALNKLLAARREISGLARAQRQRERKWQRTAAPTATATAQPLPRRQNRSLAPAVQITGRASRQQRAGLLPGAIRLGPEWHGSPTPALVGTGRSRGMMSQPLTLLDKIWQNHVVAAEPGCPSVLYIDLHLVHEVTSPQAFDGLRARGLPVRRPDRTFATIDHSIPTHDPSLPIADAMCAKQIAQLETNCREFGITLFGRGDPRRGVVHAIGPEQGLTQPGQTVVCGDSHTATHGAFGALAFGIGTSEVEHVLATPVPAAAQAAVPARGDHRPEPVHRRCRRASPPRT